MLSRARQDRHNPSPDYSQQSAESKPLRSRAMGLCLEVACKPQWKVYQQEENQACWQIDQSRPAFTSRARSLRAPLLG